MILQRWYQGNIKTEEDRRQPVTLFIESVKKMQKIRNDSSLNNFISLIEQKKQGIFEKGVFSKINVGTYDFNKTNMIY